MFKNIFKIPEPIFADIDKLLTPIELTKAQRYASLIHQCLMAGIKIPSEFTAEYNKAIDIETPRRGKQSTTSNILYPKYPGHGKVETNTPELPKKRP